MFKLQVKWALMKLKTICKFKEETPKAGEFQSQAEKSQVAVDLIQKTKMMKASKVVVH